MSEKKIPEQIKKRQDLEEFMSNDVKDDFVERRSGDDRRGAYVVGGRRKTDITEEEADAYNKLLGTAMGEKAKDKVLSERKVRNLNDEAKKIDIKKIVNVYKLNIQRISTLLIFIIVCAVVIVTANFIIRKEKQDKIRQEDSLRKLQKSITKEQTEASINGAIENFNKNTK